jgi:chromosome segregation ATPase
MTTIYTIAKLFPSAKRTNKFPVPRTRFDEITGKNGTQTDDGELRGLHLRKPGKTLSQTEPMNTKIDELFATLRNLISDQTRDLAMAMAELRSVAQQRDKALTERDEAGVRADFADLAAERQSAELEKLRIVHRDSVAGWNKAAIERDKLRDERDSANWNLSRAKESLRASEQEVEEIDTLCNDLRRANARLVADLAAATQRADTAEAILRAKA